MAVVQNKKTDSDKSNQSTGQGDKIIHQSELVTEDKKQGFVTHSITIKVIKQKEIYDRVYKELAKNVDIPGFRAGTAPRSQVEPKIYQNLINQTLNLVINLAAQEFLVNNKINSILTPEVSDLKFNLIETPITFSITFYPITLVKIGSLSTIKINKEPIEVTDKEIEQTIQNLWQKWQSHNQKNKELLAKYKKPSDAWVKELFAQDKQKVNNLAELKERVKREVEMNKKAMQYQSNLDKAVKQAVKEAKITVAPKPKEILIEREFKKMEEQLKNYKTTMDKFLETQKMAIDQYKEKLGHKVEEDLARNIFWSSYITQFEIKIDPQQDRNYLEQALRQLPLQMDGDKATITPQQLTQASEIATLYKALDDFAKKIGLTQPLEEKNSTKTSSKAPSTKSDPKTK